MLKVIEQDPESGAEVDPGSTVVITIGLPKISLPDGKPTQPMPLPAQLPAETPTTLPAEQPAAAPQPSLPTTP